MNVHPGLILASFFQPAPMADAKDWAEQMADRVPALAQRAAARDGFALSLLNVRAAVETASAREMEKTANLLIGQRLLREPGFYVLERSAFDQVAQEIALGKKAADSFWTGSYLVDGTLDTPLTAGDAVVLTLRFRPGTGPMVEVQARGPRENLAAVLDEAVTGMHAALTHAPVPALPAEEAAHFIKEAHWQVRTGQYRQARQSMDTAWALGARDFEARHYRLLCHTWALQIPIIEASKSVRLLVPEARSYTWSTRDFFNQPFRGEDAPTPDAAFEAVMEILAQYEDCRKEVAEDRDDARFAEWLALCGDTLHAACFMPILLDTAAMKIQCADKLAQVRAAIEPMFRAAVAAQPPGPESVLAHGQLMKEFASYLIVWPASFEQAQEAQRQIMNLHFPGKEDMFVRANIRSKLLDSLQAATAYYTDPKDPHRESGTYLVTYSQFLSGSGLTSAQRQTLADGYKNSAAADDRLFAWEDSIRRLRNDVAGGKIAMQMMISVLWELAPDLSRDRRIFDLYSSSCEPLYSGPYSDGAKGELHKNDEGSYFSTEIRNFRRKLFCYLLAQHAHINEVSSLMESISHDDPSPSEAEEIRQPLAAYLAAEPSAEQRLSYFMDHFGLSKQPTKLPALLVKKFWEPTALRHESGRDFDTSTERMVWAEDRLWLVGDIFDRGFSDTDSTPYVFSIEFPSMHATTIPLPPMPKARMVGKGALMVTPNRLIVTETEKALLIYDRKKKTWETVLEILPLNPPQILGDDLYILIKGGLLRYDMVKRTTEVVSSNRRNPPQNPMEEQAAEPTYIRWNDNHELEIQGAVADQKRTWCSYSPTTHVVRKIEKPVVLWKTEYQLRKFPGYLGMMPISGEQGSTERGSFHLSFDGADNPTTEIPLIFATNPEIERARKWSNRPAVDINPSNVLVTKHGWIIPDQDPTGNKYVWFLPLADLKKYLHENPDALPMIEAYEKKNGTILLPKDPP